MKVCSFARRALALLIPLGGLAAVGWGAWLYDPRAAPLVVGAILLADFWAGRLGGLVVQIAWARLLRRDEDRGGEGGA